jgi:hypothetical protein
MPPPTVVALLTCASIYQDDVSRKASLLGVCNGFQSPMFPTQMPRLFVYLAMTDGRGPVHISVRLVDGSDQNPPVFMSPDLAAQFSSPLETKEFAVETTPIALSVPGLYRWQVVCDGQVIHERTFPVQQV